MRVNEPSSSGRFDEADEARIDELVADFVDRYNLGEELSVERILASEVV